MSNFRILNSENIHRKSISSTISVKYNKDSALTPPVRINNFYQTTGVLNTLSREGLPVIYRCNQPISFNKFSRYDNTDGNISDLGSLSELPTFLEYLKYRLTSITIVKKNINTIGGPQPTESQFQGFKNDEIIVTLRDKDVFPIFNNTVVDNNVPSARTPPQDGDIINYKVIRTDKSEWVNLEAGNNTFSNWGVEIGIIHTNNATVTVPPSTTTAFTLRQVFLQQHFFSFTFTFEFEYKIGRPDLLQTNIEEEKITMVNLYKLLNSFFRHKPSKLDNKLDGVSKEVIEEIKKNQKKKGIYIDEPFTEDEIKDFVTKIITSMRGNII